MTTGTVKFFDPDKGYGFIKPDDSSGDVFVHISALKRSGIADLEDGDEVSFDLIYDEKRGKSAAENLKRV